MHLQGKGVVGHICIGRIYSWVAPLAVRWLSALIGRWSNDCPGLAVGTVKAKNSGAIFLFYCDCNNNATFFYIHRYFSDLKKNEVFIDG